MRPLNGFEGRGTHQESGRSQISDQDPILTPTSSVAIERLSSLATMGCGGLI